jgi:hypothetical protein
MYGRRGELTSTQIAVIVLVIVGFVIVVVFLGLFFEEKPDKELCRLSILERATAPGLSDEIPLNCKAEKVCIVTDKKNDCPNLGKEGVRKVVLDIPTGSSLADDLKRKKALRKIEEETANAIFDCWKTTGQGKLDVFGGTVNSIVEGAKIDVWKEKVKPQCIVCSRLTIGNDVHEIDEEVIKNNEESFFEGMDVNNYMGTTNVPGTGKTYNSIFTGESGPGGYAEFSKELSLNKNEEGLDKRTTSEIAILFLQIKVSAETPSSVFRDAWGQGFLAGNAILFGTKQLLAGGVWGIFLKQLAVGAVSAGFALEAEDQQEENQLVAGASCGNLLSKDGERIGCSFVQTMEWNSKLINDKCSGGVFGKL